MIQRWTYSDLHWCTEDFYSCVPAPAGCNGITQWCRLSFLGGLRFTFNRNRWIYVVTRTFCTSSLKGRKQRKSRLEILNWTASVKTLVEGDSYWVIDKALLGCSSNRLQNTSQIIPFVLIAVMAQNLPSNLLTQFWDAYETWSLFAYLGIDFVANGAISIQWY